MREESVIEFVKESLKSDYPDSRKMVIYFYGGDMEVCAKKARIEFGLNSDWKVNKWEAATI